MSTTEQQTSTTDTETKPAGRSQCGERAERLWTGTFALIVFLTFLCFLTGQGANSSLSVFISLKGGSSTFAGVLAAVFSISAAAARLAVGPLVDRYGRRIFITAGFAILLAGCLGPLASTAAPAFVLWRILQGAGFSAVTSATATAAADVLALSRLGEGMGYQGLGQAVAMSIGPAIALWLVGTNPAENVFFGLAAVAAVGLALSFLCVYERHPERLSPSSAYYQRMRAADAGRDRAVDGEREEGGGKGDGEGEGEGGSPAEGGSRAGGGNASPAAGAAEAVPTAAATNAATVREAGPPAADETGHGKAAPRKPRGWRRFFEPAALPGVLPILVLSPLFGFSIYFCGLYGTTIGVGNSGLYFTLSALTMIAVRVSGKRFMDRVGPLWLHLVAAACGMFAMGLLFCASWNQLLFYAAGPFYGVCMGLGIPVNQSVVVKCAPADRWGVANSAFLLSQDVGIGIAVVLWGAINDGFGFGVSLASAIAVAALSLAVAWLVYPNHGTRPLTARGIG